MPLSDPQLLVSTGATLMAFNMFMTIRQGKRESAALEARLAAKMAHA